jgi:hypothetical protein
MPCCKAQHNKTCAGDRSSFLATDPTVASSNRRRSEEPPNEQYACSKIP